MHLPDITEVDPVDATDMAILAEIQDVLKRHNALGRFGVNLLHQHFDMADDEIMVEYTDVASRTQMIRVEKIGHPLGEHESVIYTRWAFSESTGLIVTTACCSYYRGNHRGCPRISN
jgi:hypothetical protein